MVNNVVNYILSNLFRVNRTGNLFAILVFIDSVGNFFFAVAAFLIESVRTPMKTMSFS